LSNPVPWQNWMVACLGYTLRMRMLFRGWPIMVNDTHTRRRRRLKMVPSGSPYVICYKSSVVTLSLSRTVYELWAHLCPKSPVSPTPLHLRPPMRGTPLHYPVHIWCEETRMMGLSWGEEIVMICLAVSTQATSVTDRQTDRQTSRRWQ